MASEKKRPGLIKSIFNLIMAVPALFSFISSFFSIVEWEIRSAGRSLFKICLLSILMLCVLTTTWLCLLVLLVVYLTHNLNFSWLAAISIATFINLLILIIIGFCIAKQKRMLDFSHSKKLLSALNPLQHKK